MKLSESICGSYVIGSNQSIVALENHYQRVLFDNGIGIAEDKKVVVFDRFEKVDEFMQGTGLGLPICKGIVDAMNGQLGCESTRNVGSIFWAFLPFEEHNVN